MTDFPGLRLMQDAADSVATHIVAHPVQFGIGAVLWLVWIGAFLFYEGYAIADPRDRWPSLTAVVNWMMDTSFVVRAVLGFVLPIYLLAHWGFRWV